MFEKSRLSWRMRGNEFKYVKEVLRNGFKAGADGSFSTRFEQKFASSYGNKFGIAFNSGTSTLHAIFLALGCGVGDEVIVPSLTPLMCGLSIHYTGATPVYSDVDEKTFLLDPIKVEKLITKKTKAILAVHMYGAVCDLNSLIKISKKYGIYLVEDCAQCHRGLTDTGQYAGTLGVAGSWSFENSKQLTSGDGGIVTTNNTLLAKKIRKIGGLGFKTLTAASGKIRTDRDLLQNPDWERFDTIGYNFRMNQLAAAVALAQTELQDKYVKLRIKSGQKYRSALADSKLLIPQKSYPGYQNTYYTFSAKFDHINSGITWSNFRKKYMEFGGDGIYAASKLLYQEPIFRKLKIGREKTPVAEKLQKSLMNFTTNQSTETEMDRQIEILIKTRRYFGDL